jgi:hypothetical protein
MAPQASLTWRPILSFSRMDTSAPLNSKSWQRDAGDMAEVCS